MTLVSPVVAIAQQQVQIQVEGSIKPHCGFEQSPVSSSTPNNALVFSVQPDDANWANQSGKIAVALSCNAPFTLAARSSHGSLKNMGAETKHIGGSFSNQIAYTLALNVSTDDASAPLVLACPSRNMADANAICATSSGSNIAVGYGAGIGDMAVTLSGSGGYPIRGRYQDTIVLALAFQ